MKKHPHHIHIGLVVVLLVLEFTVFKGYGIISTLGKLGVSFAEGYEAALSGNSAALEGLLPSVIAFIAALVVYYLLAGAIILIFRMFSRDKAEKKE